MRAYFDNAASTPLLPEVLEAMVPYMTQHVGNPSSTHQAGRVLRVAIESARRRIADCLGTSPACIYFTSGGTEANNAALHAMLSSDVTAVISSPLEHACVRASLAYMTKQKKIPLLHVENKGDGSIDLPALGARLAAHSKGRVLLSLMHANNEIGNLTSWAQVAEQLPRDGVLFHSDAVQSVGKYDLSLDACDYLHAMTASAHKFHGPKGVGFFHLHPALDKEPLLRGGAQERGMRAGTEYVAGIVGMAEALSLACRALPSRRQKVQSLKERMKERLQALPTEVVFNGDPSPERSLYNLLSVSFPSYQDAQTLCQRLDMEGIAVSAGSACASGALQASHVLTHLDTPPDCGAIRLSFSHLNTEEEVDRTAEKIKEIVC